MLNIKRLFLVCISFSVFFAVSAVNAQKHNQFNANKQRTGVWKKYYKNKMIRYTGQFKDGKEVGTFKFYDQNSSQFPMAIKKFHPKSDSVSVQYFFLNGMLKTTGLFLGRERAGKWLYYFPKGTVMSEEFYNNGKLSGSLKVFYKNGKLTENTIYKEGMLHGVSKKYADTGILIEEVNYANGKENGDAMYYELNGSLRERGLYKNGKRIGKWEFYLDGEVIDAKKKKALKKYKKKG